MQVESLGREDPLEEGMATHPSILAWRVPQTEETGGLWSTGMWRAGHDWSDLACMPACASFCLWFMAWVSASTCVSSCVHHSLQLDFLPFELGEACVFLSWDLSCLHYFLKILSLSSRSFLFSLVTNAVNAFSSFTNPWPLVLGQRLLLDPVTWLPLQSLTIHQPCYLTLCVTGSLAFHQHKNLGFSGWGATVCWRGAAGGLPAQIETNQMIIGDIPRFPCLKGTCFLV